MEGDNKHVGNDHRRSGYHGWRSTNGLSKLKFLQARLSYALQVRTRTAAEARRASEEQLKRQRRMSSKSNTCITSKRTSAQEVANNTTTTKAKTIHSTTPPQSSSHQTDLLSYLLTQAFFKRSLADFLTPIDALKFGQTSRHAQLIKLLPPAAIFQQKSLRWYKQPHPVMTASSSSSSSSSWQPLPLRHRSADIHAVCLTTTCRWCDRCLGGRVDEHNVSISSPNHHKNNTVSVIAIMQGDDDKNNDMNSNNNCRMMCCQDLSPRAVLTHHPSQSESSFIFRADHDKDRVIRGYSVWARVGGGGVHFLHARRLCLRESVYA